MREHTGVHTHDLDILGVILPAHWLISEMVNVLRNDSKNIEILNCSDCHLLPEICQISQVPHYEVIQGDAAPWTGCMSFVFPTAGEAISADFILSFGILA